MYITITYTCTGGLKSVAIIMCLHNSVNLSRGRAVTNVGRTCGPTPLLVLLIILLCNKISLYYTKKHLLFFFFFFFNICCFTNLMLIKSVSMQISYP